MDPTLNPFFEPQGVVVIGVSSDPAKLGYGIAQNLVKGGYPGAIHFVNPKGGRLFGRSIHSDVADVSDPVDLAIILIPPAAVPAALEACGERGIRAAVIASGGFRETGAQGLALEEACLAVARAHNMRLLGPNCIGLLNTHLPLDTTFLPPPAPAAGDIAFISHSGAICAAIVDWSRGQGFGFSHLVSLGNQADVTETDILPTVAADPHTRAIALYLESVSDGERFIQVAGSITPYKPLVVLKVGRTASGQKAAASHTGALAGQETALQAALQRAGIQRAATAEQLFDWARALAWCPIEGTWGGKAGAGRDAPLQKIAVLTNAGGPGVMAADAIEAEGLALAELGQETQARLRALLPPAAGTSNPVDMLASASPEQYAQCLALLLADGRVDAILVILPPPPMFTAGAVARALIPLIQTADKPVVVALMGHGLVGEAQAFLRAVQIPTYTFPEAAVSALGALARRAAFLARPADEPPHLDNIEPEIVHRELAGRDGWLPQDALFRILAAYGVASPAYRIVSTADEAVAAAQAIGYPVAMKIDAPQSTHKSDVGGVILNVAGDEEAAAVFGRLAAIAGAQPRILVQKMISAEQEVIAGITRDAQFGPLLMFGSGGIDVEGLRDVAFALAPLNEREAAELLQATWAGRKLDGYRHIAAVDKRGVIDVLLRLGRLAVDLPQFAEIEINPLVIAAGKAVAVDARARIVG